jgi:site-specific DNA-cytosine methylase
VVLSEFNLAHPTLNRLLTMREMARLMGYPDDWVFHVLHPRLVAQGVPVANARWAASRLMEALTAAHS